MLGKKIPSTSVHAPRHDRAAGRASDHQRPSIPSEPSSSGYLLDIFAYANVPGRIIKVKPSEMGLLVAE
jgi:hypothetical protein